MRFSNLISPRAIIIAVLIVVSSASFILGFLVGKLGQAGPAPQGQTDIEKTESYAESYANHTSEEVSVAQPSLPKRQDPVYDLNPSEVNSAAEGTDAAAYYTVQVGAFKTRNDAEAVKKRLLSKGYKAYIIEKDGMHRVRAGRFKEKKQADVLALRIKKTEGLEAFVTVD